jgi:protein SCO1/2
VRYDQFAQPQLASCIFLQLYAVENMARIQPGGPPEPKTLQIMIGVITATLLVFVIVPGILMAATPHPHGTVYDEPALVPDFLLPRADGGVFRLSDLRGKVAVIYFGYTSCPDVCPTTLYDLRRTLEDLGEDASDVAVVFITIDPENDTPEKIENYLGYFNPDFIGLYGTEEQLQPVMDRFDVVVQREDAGQTVPGYAITHTTAMFVLDREGYLVLRMHHNTDVRYLVRDLQYALKGRL